MVNERGFDPGWGEVGGLSYTNFLVRHPCESVIPAFREDSALPDRMTDLLKESGGRIGPIAGEPVYIFQLRGHDWTQVEATGAVAWNWETARDLSLRFNTQAFVHDWEDIASGRCYSLYERGELVESFSMFHGNPIYQGVEGEADLRQKLAKGWRISRDHTFEFLTNRNTVLDIESSKECQGLHERVAEDLGMYVAAFPFWHDSISASFELSPGWTRDSFAVAKAFYRSMAG